jgi:3-(methylthio)propanoyl-CoA dehydrogenase
VILPDSFKRVYDQYVEAGWGTLQHPTEFGGGGFPLTVANAVKETINSANLAFSLGPLLTTGAVYLLTHHGSDEQKQTYLPKMVTGEWSGTMNLTEPQAGSDVGAVTTKAVPADDGTYRITGQKIYITFGEHQLTENIIHLVLARLPDAPPGTKGISLFIVPKFLVNEDGSLGERNDVKVVSVEHKLGIHASPTCVMAYGDDGEGAIGYLVGEPNTGMRGMFTMMNDARLGVGIQGLAIAERAYQQSLAYAQERRQGRGPTSAPGEQAPDHRARRRAADAADAEGLDRGDAGPVLPNAHALDLAHGSDDPVVREQQQKLADLLTPLSKAWCTDLGVELTSLAVQVHGGMGYVEETGVAQHYRDARIAPIYEGTNGIQALDLVGRKLPYDGGAFVKSFLADLAAFPDQLPAEPVVDRRPAARGRRAARGAHHLDLRAPRGAQRRLRRRDPLPAGVRHRRRRVAARQGRQGRPGAARRRVRGGGLPRGADRHGPVLRRAAAAAGRRPRRRGDGRRGRPLRAVAGAAGLPLGQPARRDAVGRGGVTVDAGEHDRRPLQGDRTGRDGEHREDRVERRRR